MEEAILRISFNVLFLLFLFERGYFQLKSRIRSRKDSKYLEGKKIQTLFIIIGQLWIIGIFLYILYPDALIWPIIDIPVWINIFGLIFTAIGMVFELYTQISLGKQFSAYLHIRNDHKLIMTGPYKYIRHPMYTALTMVLFGLFLASSNVYVGLPLPIFVLVIGLRIGREEEVLIEKFGNDYITYMKTTGRFIPRFRK
ncbi:MAG: methyltransferase family protein [Candidatus Hodarchaeales archaeon]|jgi:protein-S-isoprenylcysteine O-methyltransferase Ste14